MRSNGRSSPWAGTKKVDLGVVTTPLGHRVFIESLGIGLLAQFRAEMWMLEKKKNSRDRRERPVTNHQSPFTFHLPLPYTSILDAQAELFLLCHAVQVPKENANTRRSKRS